MKRLTKEERGIKMSNLKIFTENIAPKALNQIYTLVKQPAFSDCKVRIMPDVHAGVGCVIGFTADLGDKVIPNIVGVDIGCGMLTVELGNIEIDYAALDSTIRKYIPSGRNVRDDCITPFDLRHLKCFDDLKDIKRIKKSLGTLGGGNHFIEIDVDSSGCKYLVIHTGSRNLGKQVAEHYQRIAIEKTHRKSELCAKQKQLINEYKAQGRNKEIQSAIKELRCKFELLQDIPNELCYLTGKDREDYLYDMKACQGFARTNRFMIGSVLIDKMGWNIYDIFENIHNYIDHKTNIVRKGAISAKTGEKLLIPINMRDGCIIGVGKGNEDWNCSAPHGAGRIMSRSEAKELVTLDEFEKSMQGIFTTSVNQSTVDESPMVYKSMAEIVENIAETVDIIKIIKPVYNYKASE